MSRFLVVCGAGAVGCGARYLVGLWAGARLGTTFPFGTLIVNIVGVFLMALVMEVSLRVVNFSPHLRLALTTGLMGGLTTYSSFNYETTKMVLDGETLRGIGYITLTIVACVIAGLLGHALARVVAGSAA